jgi:hypothetical protein
MQDYIGDILGARPGFSLLYPSNVAWAKYDGNHKRGKPNAGAQPCRTTAKSDTRNA